MQDNTHSPIHLPIGSTVPIDRANSKRACPKSLRSVRWRRAIGSLAIALCLWGGTAAVVQAQNPEVAAMRRSGQRWIEVNLSTQRLVAWEGNDPVYAIVVSTGSDDHPTPTGSFEIEQKLRTTRMQGDDYDVPDVPYTLYYDGSYAIHGAYWHHRFGTPVSHGCVNVAVDHAEWLYNWASVGTTVLVHY